MRQASKCVLLVAPILVTPVASAGVDPIVQQSLPVASPTLSKSVGLTVGADPGGAAPPPTATATVMVNVKVIKILGNSLFDTATLQALVEDAVGKRLSLDQLDELAARIGNYYRARGHRSVRVITPAQRFQAGIVRILVIEAPQTRAAGDKRARLNDLLLQDLSYDLLPEATTSPAKDGKVDRIDKALDSLPPGASVLIDVKALKILGNTLYGAATLHPLVADAEGKSLTYDQLDELAVRIRNYYHSRGHRSARVVTPAQIIRAGVVRILVIEAPFGRIGSDSQVRLNDLLRQGLASAQGAASLKPSPESTSLEVEVQKLRVVGATSFDETTLHALVADGEGKKLNLAQLDQLAARISNYYRSRGYPYARAVVPAQIIQSGIVHLLVVEARYGKVELENQSRVTDSLVRSTMSRIQPGQPIDQAQLDEALLLLADTPGVLVDATLKPGQSPGTADLMLQAGPGPEYSGNLTLDDYGNSYTGRMRLGGNLQFNNPLHRGDVLSLGGLSAGTRLNYGRIGYDSLLNGRGTRAGGAYASMNYGLGGSLTNLDARGSTETGSVWLKHPFLRSQSANLYGQLQYDAILLRERIGVAAVETDRHVNNWTWTLTGDWRDMLLSGGISTLSLGWTKGRVGFDNVSAESTDAATARTQGEFSRWNLSLSRLQSVGARTTLYAAFTGQWADRNLDSSQKMSVGGPYSVRAYEVGVLSGDAGYRGTLEFRYDHGPLWQGRFETVLFVDGAYVTVNQSPWTTGTNSASLSGAGIGFNWTGQRQWKVRTYIATPIGSPPELVRNPDSTRAGSEIGFQF